MQKREWSKYIQANAFRDDTAMYDGRSPRRAQFGVTEYRHHVTRGRNRSAMMPLRENGGGGTSRSGREQGNVQRRIVAHTIPGGSKRNKTTTTTQRRPNNNACDDRIQSDGHRRRRLMRSLVTIPRAVFLFLLFFSLLFPSVTTMDNQAEQFSCQAAAWKKRTVG